MRENNEIRRDIVNDLVNQHGIESVISRRDIEAAAVNHNAKVWNSWIGAARIGHGKYSIQMLYNLHVGSSTPSVNKPLRNDPVSVEKTPKVSLVPEVDPLYVPTQWYDTILKVVQSNSFFPVYITGQSGNGKSKTVVQAAAAAGRELIRINVTAGTDAEELIGHQTLQVDTATGQTITQYVKGPIIEAMERGALVLIDEIDLLNPNKAGELYTALEGAGTYIKAINERIIPKTGFNIIATANTTGQGDDDGRYVGTGILSEAFLERFPITLRFDYADKKTENKIISRLFRSLNLTTEEDKTFSKNLLDWIQVIRTSFTEGATDAVISTRRTVAIIEAYSIFRDRRTAIEMCISRFDEETRNSFWELYEKIDETMTESTTNETPLENNENVNGSQE
jgi:MoxR-like ATPase